MTKEAALKAFFNSFGIPAYPSSAVPDDVIFPYLTYDPVTDAFESAPVGITVNLWYYTSQESPPNEKAREISKRIGTGGAVIPCDEGFIWLMRGSPWCQNLRDDSDRNIKRRHINISAEFLTAY